MKKQYTQPAIEVTTIRCTTAIQIVSLGVNMGVPTNDQW